MKGMPKRKRRTQQLEYEYQDQLIEHIRSLYREDQLTQFLEGLLTPKELSEMSTRLQIIKQLKRGLPQREVAGNLGVGIATVTRGAREIQKGRFESVA